MRRKASGALKSAITKVIGLFDCRSRFVFIDKSLHASKQTFVRLHETGHGTMEWQCDAYALVEECQRTLDPELADLFEREANVFASEVLFQLDKFETEAAEYDFSVFTPIKLSKKYGGSIYATIRRYVTTSWRACTVLVLNPPQFTEGDGFRAYLRRQVPSSRFTEIFGAVNWPEYFTPDDSIGTIIPKAGRKASGKRQIGLVDRRGEYRDCIVEVFTQTYQVFVLIHDVGALSQKNFIMPKSAKRISPRPNS